MGTQQNANFAADLRTQICVKLRMSTKTELFEQKPILQYLDYKWNQYHSTLFFNVKHFMRIIKANLR